MTKQLPIDPLLEIAALADSLKNIQYLHGSSDVQQEFKSALLRLVNDLNEAASKATSEYDRRTIAKIAINAKALIDQVSKEDPNKKDNLYGQYADAIDQFYQDSVILASNLPNVLKSIAIVTTAAVTFVLGFIQPIFFLAPKIIEDSANISVKNASSFLLFGKSSKLDPKIIETINNRLQKIKDSANEILVQTKEPTDDTDKIEMQEISTQPKP